MPRVWFSAPGCASFPFGAIVSASARAEARAADAPELFKALADAAETTNDPVALRELAEGMAAVPGPAGGDEARRK